MTDDDEDDYHKNNIIKINNKDNNNVTHTADFYASCKHNHMPALNRRNVFSLILHKFLDDKPGEILDTNRHWIHTKAEDWVSKSKVK